MADFGGPSDMAGGEKKESRLKLRFLACLDGEQISGNRWGMCMGIGRLSSACMCSVQY